jgi:hypothetical protein
MYILFCCDVTGVNTNSVDHQLKQFYHSVVLTTCQYWLQERGNTMLKRLFASSEFDVELEAALTGVCLNFHSSCVLTFNKAELILIRGYIYPFSFLRANFELQKHIKQCKRFNTTINGFYLV